jgi:hypothetical protein
MTKSERRIKRLEQQGTQDDEELVPAEVIHLMEEMLGEKLTEEEKRRPRKRGAVPPEVKAMIDTMVGRPS